MKAIDGGVAGKLNFYPYSPQTYMNKFVDVCWPMLLETYNGWCILHY